MLRGSLQTKMYSRQRFLHAGVVNQGRTLTDIEREANGVTSAEPALVIPGGHSTENKGDGGIQYSS
jgi:hypothetical protein